MALGGVRRRKDRNRYLVDWYDGQGRRHRELMPPTFTKTDAERYHAKRVDEVGRAVRGLPPKSTIAFGEWVEATWRKDIGPLLKPSTRDGYEKVLRNYLLPSFGTWPLKAITRPAVKTFIAQMSQRQRRSFSRRNPNPNRPTYSKKTIRNVVAILSSILGSAAEDYELIPANPLAGIMSERKKRRHLPADAFRPTERRPRILQPDEFKMAVQELRSRPRVLVMVLLAALTGARWSEQTALRIEEDVDFRRNRLRITRSLYKRIPQTLKTDESEGEVTLSPAARRILQAVPYPAGYVFSVDGGTTPIGNGTWIKRQWRAAQVRAGIRRPIRWHDLRHTFVSLLVAIGKHPRYIAQQARHADAGFTMKQYAHLFEEVAPTPLEWPEDLLWPGGLPEELQEAGANWGPNRSEKRGSAEGVPVTTGERGNGPEPLS